MNKTIKLDIHNNRAKIEYSKARLFKVPKNSMKTSIMKPSRKRMLSKIKMNYLPLSDEEIVDIKKALESKARSTRPLKI